MGMATLAAMAEWHLTWADSIPTEVRRTALRLGFTLAPAVSEVHLPAGQVKASTLRDQVSIRKNGRVQCICDIASAEAKIEALACGVNCT